jgi:hypothetical protein
VAGALAVVEQDVREPVNLCTGVGTSDGRARAAVLQVPRATAPDIELRADKPAGVAYRVGDPARFRGIYLPKVDIGEGVARALR